MPSYYSRLTTVQLAVADLRDTTTIKSENRSHPGVYDEISSCAAKFANASITGTFDETPILTEDVNRSHMRYLGKFGDMPFFMVRAGQAFLELDTERRRTRRPARVPDPIVNSVSGPQHSTSLRPSAINDEVGAGSANKPLGCEDDHARILRQIQLSTALPPGAKPHAIFLSVFLSKASFLPTVVQHPKKTIYHDIKIDVYFNGELCASTFVSDRYHGDSYRMTEQIIRFSGRRVHRQLEKPWVLVPPGQSPDGRPRPDKQNIGLPGDAKGQWASVSKALMMEADKLGRGRNGELSVLGDYLSTLADLEMPAEVGGMQKAGGPKMGIIDVVVTAGKGHKDDANALRLMEPTPIRLEGLATAEAKISPPHPTPDEIFTTPITNQQSLSLRAKAETLAQGFTSQPQNQRGSQSRLESDPMSSGNQTTLFSRERAQSFGVRQLNDLNATGMHGGSSNTKISSDTPVPVTPSFNNLMHPPRPKRKLQSPSMNPSSDSAPSNQPAERKPRFKWEIVLDNKLTLEEEMKGIATRAAKTPNHDSGIDADNPAQERRLRLRPRDKKDNPLPPGLDVPQGPTSSSPYTLPHHHHHQSSSTPKSTPKINTITPQPPEPASDSFTPDSSASRRHRPGPPTPLSLGGWQGTPPLSNDAVVTYAAGDVLRQVKGERNGWFKEAGVVMGARFLVG